MTTSRNLFHGLLISLFGFSAAQAALPKDARRPGGIAVLALDNQTSHVALNKLPVAIVSDQGKRYALVGIPLSITAGELVIQSNTGDIKIQINDYPYAEQRISLKDNKYVAPDEESLARYKREADEQNAVYQSFSAHNDSFPHFIAPTKGKFSNSFGRKRFFNGEPRAPHSGLDIPAPQGQAVISPADGVVVQTGDYFFNGQTVMIDHGHGIISMLCHLSTIKANVGDMVKQGDVVGLVGKTGRVTGAHLHWSLSMNDARVDPQLVLQK